jgi:two-component system chemotaxis sensor kinase CheA
VLIVSARQSGNQILIDIQDDGRGINAKRLVEKAVSVGVVKKAEAADLSKREQLALIFEAGLSTASQVTAISGRGVGMDVVRSNIERIGGIVEVDSTLGEGTRMTLRVPLTLTIIPALTVSVAGQSFAIPRSAIDEIVRANGESVTLEKLGGAGVATIRGRRVPEIALSDVLGLESAVPEEERSLVVLRPAGADVYALAVDRIHDHEELVVKPAAPAIMATGLYAGTTLADDGSPILLFDPAGIAKVGGVKLEAHDRAARLAETAVVPIVSDETPVLLFRGLDGGRRAMRLAVVDRIEEVPAAAIRPGAGQLRVQLGETILPLAGVNGDLPTEKVRLFRLNDGAREIGYAFREVVDMSVVGTEIISASSPGEISGVALISGEPAELLDPHWLFANFAASAAPAEQLICRLPADDPWMHNMLRPIVEAAGYRVISDAAEVEADLAILSEASSGDAAAVRTIRLRADPDPASEKDETIYRYDRAALLMALKSAGAGRR